MTPWTAVPHTSLSITICWSLLKLTSIKSVMPSNHLILCHPLLLLPSIFPSIRVSCSEAALCIRWPNRHFIFDISPSSVHSGLISFRIDWFISLQSKGLSRVFSSTTVQKHQFFGAQTTLWINSYIHTCRVNSACLRVGQQRAPGHQTSLLVIQQLPLALPLVPPYGLKGGSQNMLKS